MANIFYRNRGTKSAPNWQYRFYGANVDGKRKEISKSGFKTKALAIEAGTAAYDEYLNGGCQIPSDKSALKMSYSDFLDFWMEEYVKINLKDTTYAGYAKKIRLYIKPNIGQYTIGSLSPASLQTFINNLFNTGLSRNTLSVIKGIVSKSLNYATVTMSILKFNPMDCVKLPSPRAKAKVPTTKKERRPVTPDEWNKIMERFPVGHPAHIPLVIAYRCGLRLGEVFALMWEDVDFTNHTLRIERQVQNDKNGWYFSPPKYDSYRTIAVDDFTLHMLKEEKAKQTKAKKYYGEYYKQLYISGFVKEPKRYVINGSLTYDATDKPVHMIMSRENGEIGRAHV